MGGAPYPPTVPGYGTPGYQGQGGYPPTVGFVNPMPSYPPQPGYPSQQPGYPPQQPGKQLNFESKKHLTFPKQAILNIRDLLQVLSIDISTLVDI